MGLTIRNISCTNFRSYTHFELDNIGDLTVIVGPNAIGKTNLIEGIQLTTACSSFRHPKPDHLIYDGASTGFFETAIEGDGRALEVKVVAADGARTFFLNRKKKRAASLRGLLPSVLFCPDDLSLVKGSQSAKRSQLDLLGSQLSVGYNAVRKDYEKILRQKNSCLKQEVSYSYLLSVNEVMASIGAQLYRLRAELLSALEPYIQQYYQALSGDKESVQVAYVPSWLRKNYDLERYHAFEIPPRTEILQTLLDAMERDYSKEAERRMSLYGPQVDRVEFYLNERNVTTFASQGQQRSLVLSYKMAEVSLIRDKLNQNPVLLLDDVMSELDNNRRSALLSLLQQGVQTFITATNAEVFDEALLKQARLVELPQ